MPASLCPVCNKPGGLHKHCESKACTCYAKSSTQGCSEWSCPYHGRENERKTLELRQACPLHGVYR